MKQHHSIAILFVLATNVLAAEPSCKILEFGIFENAKPVEIQDYPSAATGKIRLYNPSSIVEHTEKVQAKIGTRFGIKHEFSDIPAGKELIAVVSHPAITSPSGEQKSETIVALNPNNKESIYGFDRESELLAGNWTFRFEVEGKTLCEKTFTVFKD